MLSCKELVKIVSSDEHLSPRYKLEIRLHLLMCHHCRKYTKQLEILKAGFKTLLNKKTQDADENKLKEIEDRIIEKISNHKD